MLALRHFDLALRIEGRKGEAISEIVSLFGGLLDGGSVSFVTIVMLIHIAVHMALVMRGLR